MSPQPETDLEAHPETARVPGAASSSPTVDVDVDLGVDDDVDPLAESLAAASLALARRFAAGATLWCWAPRHPEHAQHVAVEFVHPVIVGKRALPAVAVTAGDGEARRLLRSLVRAGDVIVVVGAEADDDQVVGVLRRAPAWGATTVWLGAGDRPAAGDADHVLWLGADAALVPHDGRLVRCLPPAVGADPCVLRAPGPADRGDRRRPPAGVGADDHAVCVTCSDEGRLGEVVDTGPLTAVVRTATGPEEIDTTLVGDVDPGDLVLVHAGTALAIVDRRSRPGDRLPLPVHRGRRARLLGAAGRPAPARPRPRRPRAPACGPRPSSGSATVIAEAAAAMADRFAAGGQLFTFGNGGSATDAAGAAHLFVRPPSGPPRPARCLAADEAVLTALGNDVGFDLVFSRQLIAYARPGDIALGLSTSGSSENLIVAFAEARRRGLLTIGLAGQDGGRMAVSGDVDHCIVVRSDSVHRIQETQAAVMLALWQGVGRALAGGGGFGRRRGERSRRAVGGQWPGG